jgi:predicted nucleic acid-binding protein
MSSQRTAKVPRYVFDSSLFISFIMNEKPRGEHVLQLLKQAQEGKIEVLYSYGALPEIQRQSQQTAEGSRMTQAGIEAFFEREEIQMVAVERTIAEKARRIMMQGPARMPIVDAILVATALVYEADALFTDDEEHLIRYSGRWDGLIICRPFGSWQTTLPIE